MHSTNDFQDNHNMRYLYAIGGWNIDYLNSVHRIEMNDEGTGPKAGAAWEAVGERHIYI